MKHDANLCGNCDRWREEHYAQDGSWLADQPCAEYIGVNPSPDRLAKREKELRKAMSGDGAV